MKKILFIVITSTLWLTSSYTLVFSQSITYDKYIWEQFTPQTITGADDLKAKLASQVQKIISSGHLLPFRTIYGEDNPHFFWYNRYDTIYTLSLVYPYLDPTTQTSLKTYLKSELSAYPIWSAVFLDPAVGTTRQSDDLPAGKYLSDAQNMLNQYQTRPRLFALYALWLYANSTGDWTYIDTNWTQIKNFYSTYSTELSQYYSGLAGGIGMVRLAAGKTTPDTATRDAVITSLISGFTTGKNYLTFSQSAETAYKWISGYIISSGGSGGTRNSFPQGFQFIDTSPEIGRYIFDDATLKSLVLGSSEFSLPEMEKRSPLWYMAQAPQFNKYSGEGSGSVPFDRAMVFPLHAWILKDSSTKLRSYLDVPDPVIGDYYYLQNLTRTIESHGSPCWKDVRNPSASCNTLGVSTSRQQENLIDKFLHFLHLP